MSKLIRIGLIDFDADVRFGRRLILESNPKVRVVFDSEGKTEDVQGVSESLIDVLVIDQRLEMGSGINFYEQLRGLTGLSEAPMAVLTSAFEQPDLRFLAFKSGFFETVSLELGPEYLVEKALAGALGKRTIGLSEIVDLVRGVKPQKQLDIELNQQVRNLPEKYQSNLRRLKSVWKKLSSGKSIDFDLTDLAGLVAKLKFQSPEETVIRLYLAGHFDDE